MNIKAIKTKVDELKALFILGSRVIPFMEELFTFIEETTPLLDDINNAIKENLKKMPNATKQLTKVTQATEMASTEIMDTVDRVNDGLYKVIEEFEEFKKLQEQLFDNPITLLETIAEGIALGKDLTPYITEIQDFIDREKNIRNNEHLEIITNIIDKVRNISDDANSIINSLQIQDITAQQLAAVNHLLENIQSRLTGIIRNINADEYNDSIKQYDDSIKISKLHRNIAFDPDAVDAITANRQDDIDAMFSAATNNNIDENPYQKAQEESPDDIINSFNQQTTNEIVEDEEFSQDDIDAMFN